jgi:hypothetical protein
MTTYTRLVQTQGFYMSLLDLASPANRPGFLDAELARAKVVEREEGYEGGTCLFLLNGFLMDAARRGELMPWSVLVPSVYLVSVELLDPGLDARVVPPYVGNLGRPIEVNLACSTGRIAVCCMSEHGSESLEPLVCIEPGVYRASLERTDEEGYHLEVNELSDYPEDEGPDFRIRRRRLSGLDSQMRRAT